jgi:kumamolisin
MAATSAAKPMLATAAAPSRRKVSVSVVLAAKQAVDAKKAAKPEGRMTRAAFAKMHGPDAASVRLIKAFAVEFGLTAEKTASPCTFALSGSQAAMEKAFGVSLEEWDWAGVSCRVREGSIYLPQELVGHVVAVLGLDTRPQAEPHLRVASARATNVSYTPVQVAQLYGFPAGATATGQTIGIIELGGGFRTKDLNAYFKGLGLPVPSVTAVSVDGGKNAPTTASGADGEVMLDIEVCAAVAVGAKIAVYFAPNTDQGFVDAISAAVHDTVNKPSVVSISWGGPESSWTGQAMTALDSACQAAAVVGVTITVASGDNGSTDGVAGTANHVDFPASSPHVLACGGTKLSGQGSTITSEVVWNETALNEGATGGGVSTVFPLPSWQTNAGVPAGGRGVPDVAGDADPATGYQVLVDGQSMVIGGTSAVAPLWAGLIALANAQNKVAAGFVNPTLYGAGAKGAFRDITQGNNGSFSAGPGWDACTGLGSPVGTGVIKAVGTGAAVKGGKGKKTGKTGRV